MNWNRAFKSAAFTIGTIGGAIIIVTAGVYAINWVLLALAVDTVQSNYIQLLGGAIILFAYVFIGSYAIYTELQQENIDELNEEGKQLKLSSDSSDVLGNVLETIGYIGKYYTTNIQNYKAIFAVGVASCSLGFIAIVAPIILLTVRPDLDATSPALVSALSGVLLEFIGGSLFYLFKSSHNIFMNFHTRLAKLQLTLTASYLNDKVEDNKLRDEVRVDIIRTIAGISNGKQYDGQLLPSQQSLDDDSTVSAKPQSPISE